MHGWFLICIMRVRNDLQVKHFIFIDNLRKYLRWQLTQYKILWLMLKDTKNRLLRSGKFVSYCFQVTFDYESIPPPLQNVYVGRWKLASGYSRSYLSGRVSFRSRGMRTTVQRKCIDIKHFYNMSWNVFISFILSKIKM